MGRVLIALLAVLGVDLIVVFACVVYGRKYWVKRQPGAFRGAIRVESGKIDGLRPKWSRGYGRWVRDILVWTKAPFLFRNVLIPADALNQQRPARDDEVKRLGDQPIVIRLKANGTFAEVAASEDDATVLLGPYHRPSNPDDRHPGVPTST
ncbi:DUF2550 family protein [Streptomyces mirabilis]|uniref:DUF2550 family protein n=1 Tax=Streptomyces mirabilis TaxID=68239 RepID=UPI001BB03658|nr:DUF2550 family protein [Streptomyces mirabilis]QUW83982.1 DUF2550 family protein [Streptomyces mirabilis]